MQYDQTLTLGHSAALLSRLNKARIVRAEKAPTETPKTPSAGQSGPDFELLLKNQPAISGGAFFNSGILNRQQAAWLRTWSRK